MIELSVIRDLVAIFSFIIGLTYYIIVLRNQQKSRQIQIISSAESPKDWGFLNWEVKSYDEFMSEYGGEANPDGWGNFMIWFNRLELFGVYVREGLLDIRFVCLLSGGTIVESWEKYQGIFREWRVRYNRPRDWVEAEFLYNRAVDYFKKHPELAPSNR